MYPLSQHEAHYETSHRNRCSACGRSFPTNRLLDLHLSEVHDSFFKAMAERRAMYVCLVEGCLQVFSSSGKRHGHLVQVHRYPESFDFSRCEVVGTKLVVCDIESCLFAPPPPETRKSAFAISAGLRINTNTMKGRETGCKGLQQKITCSLSIIVI